MGKKLVAYFSASGVTAHVAKELADAVAADVVEGKVLKAGEPAEAIRTLAD